MAWVKIDDDFFGNPKVIRAGRDARDLYLAALCFCNRGLTDGFVPEEALRRLAADAEVDNAEALAARLVAVGLWLPWDGGWKVKDYLEYQPSKAQVQATREARAEAGRRGGKQKASNLLERGQANSQANGQANAKQNSTPSRTRPVPEPVKNPGPPDGGERARTRAAQGAAVVSLPYALFSAWCDEMGMDEGAATEADKRQHCAIAKRLAAEHGVDEPELRACLRYLASESWRDKAPNLAAVEKAIGEWRMLGRPARASPRASPNGSRSADRASKLAEAVRLGMGEPP